MGISSALNDDGIVRKRCFIVFQSPMGISSALNYDVISVRVTHETVSIPHGDF